MLGEEDLQHLARLCRDHLRDLRKQTRYGALDISDVLPYLRAAACLQGSTAEWFGARALARGDIAATLWALLDADQQFAAYLNRCHRVAQLEAELRQLRTSNRNG